MDYGRAYDTGPKSGAGGTPILWAHFLFLLTLFYLEIFLKKTAKHIAFKIVSLELPRI